MVMFKFNASGLFSSWPLLWPFCRKNKSCLQQKLSETLSKLLDVVVVSFMCPRSERSDLSTHHNSVKTGGLHCSPFPVPDGKESKSFRGLDACGILLRWFRLGWPVWDDPNLDLDHGTSWKIMEHLDVKTVPLTGAPRRDVRHGLCGAGNRRVLLGGGLMNDFATLCCNPKVPSSKALLRTYSGRFPWSSPVDDSHVEQGSPLYSTPEQGETGQLRSVFPSQWCEVCLKNVFVSSKSC